MDLIIEARAWVNGALRNVEIGILEGMIKAVKHDLPGSPRQRYRGKLLLPSGVDWHVHMREPGATQKEDFRTGTTAAALGGIGTVFDMPNTSPVVDRPSRLQEKADLVAPKACVDWGLWATVTPQTVQLDKLLSNANGVKLFLSHTTNVDASLTDAQVASTIEAAQAQRRWVLVHAEDPPGTAVARTTRDHDQNRTAEGEVHAIEHLASLLQDRSGVHVAHATTAEALQAAAAAGFNAAVTPHHLLLSYDTAQDARGKVNPPLRSEARRAGLWDALNHGLVPQIESDHAPHTIADKSQSFHEAPSGMPGVETLLPLLLYACKAGDTSLEAVIPAACERPAANLGLDRGRIAPGYRADFFLIDPTDPSPVRGDRLASKAGWSPFEGRKALFPEVHYLNGEVIVEEGHFIGRPGMGRRVPPRPRPTAPSSAPSTTNPKTA